MTSSIAIVFVAMALLLGLFTVATEAVSTFASLPVDYNSSEIHYTITLECGTGAESLCTPATTYTIDAPPVDCATILSSDILWTTEDLKTVIAHNLNSPFDFTIPSPFTQDNQFDGQTVKGYIRIVKDVACDSGEIQSAESGDVFFAINGTTNLSTRQYIATPPFTQVIQPPGDSPIARAALKVYPKEGLNPNRLEIELTQIPISDFQFIEQVEIIPTGLWQLSSNAPPQLKCIFIFEDDEKDYTYAKWGKSANGNYFSYTIPVSEHHIPAVASPIILTCIGDQTDASFTPDLTQKSNGLIIRYSSSNLDPRFEIQAFVTEPLTTQGKTTPQLQLIDFQTQVGPFNPEQYPYFSHDEPFNPLIARYSQSLGFDQGVLPDYRSYFQFEFPIVSPTDMSKIDKEKDIMFPCLMQENYRLKVSTQEFGLLGADFVPPTIDLIRKMTKQSQFTVTCAAQDKKKKTFSNQLVYVGNFTATDVTTFQHLTDTSLPQYPLVTFSPDSQEEIDFRNYNQCESNSYKINVFLEISSNEIPSLNTRNRGIFMLENRYDYAPGRWEPSGGQIVDTAMFSLTSVSRTSAKQRYVYDPVSNDIKFSIKYSPVGNKRYELISIDLIPPKGNGEGQPADKHDNSFAIALGTMGFFFTTDAPSLSSSIQISCEVSPALDKVSSYHTVVGPNRILIEGYDLSQVPQGQTVTLKCTSNGNRLFLQAGLDGINTNVKFLIQQENVVTAPVLFKFQPQNDSTSHLFRNLLVALIVITAIFAIVYFALKAYNKKQAKKEVQGLSLEATDYNLPGGDSGGYDNLQN